MRPYCLLVLCGMLSGALQAQYQIGHTSITFTDPARNNRPVLTEIYYPADSAGDNVAIAAGLFPVIHFGHGFVMVWSAYQNFPDTLVPQGYILCFPRTEGSFSPNHTEFARDLAFLCSAMEAENTQPASAFFGHVMPRHCIMGHSMGGGCTVLAYQYNPDLIKCLATFAAANTNPSAIAVAPGVQAPSLTFAGSYDCIAPPAQQARAIYEALDSAACKIYFNIDGGSHCQFANANTNCSLGESFSGCATPPVTRQAQQALVNGVLLPWLNFYLREDQGAWPVLLDALATANGFSSENTCLGITRLSEPPAAGPDWQLVGNILTDSSLAVQITGISQNTVFDFFIFDASGKLITAVSGQWMAPEAPLTISTAGFPRGVLYLVAVDQKGEKRGQKIIVR